MKRGTNPESLKNLQAGRVGAGKVRVTLTLLPETIELLDSFGNRSDAIDKAIALLAKYKMLDEIKNSSP